jgi:predicted transcriptional regulator
MPTVTSSIRVPGALQNRLERTAKRLKKGRNWIINQALDEYLRKLDREALVAEARRQSLLARDAEAKNDDDFLGKASRYSRLPMNCGGIVVCGSGSVLSSQKEADSDAPLNSICHPAHNARLLHRALTLLKFRLQKHKGKLYPFSVL